MTVLAVLAAALLGPLLLWKLARVDLAWTFSLAIAASIFSGNSDRIGFPIGPDRLLFAYGMSLVAWRALAEHRRTGESGLPPVRPVHWLLALLSIYVGLSALAHHELFTATGFFALLDRLGVVPFIMFYLAPVLFGTRAQRLVLLRVLTVVGTYLALISVFPAIGLESLIVPNYITDITVGIHVERARGPFLEAAAHGVALIGCSIAAAVLALSRTGLARFAAATVSAGCLLATVFTVTRSIWIAAVVAAVVGSLMSRELRRFALPGLLVLALGAASVVGSVPGLTEQADDRAQSQGPIWDRLNTNAAAFRAVRAEPIFGIGWNRFPTDGPAYLRQATDYPLTNSAVGLPVHNVPLSYMAELGILGFALWSLAFVNTLVLPILRPVRAGTDAWRAGLGALVASWFTVAMLVPLGYAFPLLLLYTWAGIVFSDGLSRPALALPPTRVRPAPGQEADEDPDGRTRKPAPVPATD